MKRCCIQVHFDEQPSGGNWLDTATTINRPDRSKRVSIHDTCDRYGHSCPTDHPFDQ